MRDVDAAYIAGLFDGEGCVSYKQYMRKRSHNKKPYPTWQIRLEIAMTDRDLYLFGSAIVFLSIYMDLHLLCKSSYR